MSKAQTKKSFFWMQTIIIVGVTFILGEITLSLLFAKKIKTPEQLNALSLQVEPALFAQHVFPLKEQNFIDNQWGIKGEGFYERYINKNGYNGKLFPQKKPKETLRIIFYGGSFVFDMFLPKGEDWPQMTEMLLHKNGFSNAEVINAGIPGHKSIDSVGRLFTEGHHFSPDYVVLCNSMNDIIRYFYTNKPLLRELKPQTPNSNPMLVYHNAIDQFLSEHSLIYTLIRQEFYRRYYDVGLRGARGRSRPYFTATQVAPKAVEQFELNVELFVDLARNIGATPILMTQPHLVTADNEHTEKFRLRNLKHSIQSHQFVYDAFQKADTTIRKVAKEKNVILIDASKEFTGKGELFIDHIHLSWKGSRKLTNFVTQHLLNIFKNQKEKATISSK